MENQEIFSVSEINAHLKNIIKSNIPQLFVQGELTNCTLHRSGHLYFGLKDEKSSLKGVMFKYYASMLDFVPQNGDEVVCFGKLDLYEASGNYQIVASSMEKKGLGELNKKFEILKKKLEKEGLFEQIYKKNIPEYPKKIGIVTSATGAAIQDIRNVLSRRFPCEIYLYPVLVQGEKAPKSIISGIQYFEKKYPVDLLIVGRGGGSQEDLFCFNSEELARMIFAAKTPIITGIGHEIDYTIADFVADLRAPTPSAAAELAVPDKAKLVEKLMDAKSLITLNSQAKITDFKLKIHRLQQNLATYSPYAKLENLKTKIDTSQLMMKHLLATKISQNTQKIEVAISKLEELSPLKTLDRGYAIIRQEQKTIRTTKQINTDKPLEIILKDGSIYLDIKAINELKNS